MPRALNNDMNRRDWLKSAGGLVVGFTFSGLAALGEQS